jgi:hypothetical protein
MIFEGVVALEALSTKFAVKRAISGMDSLMGFEVGLEAEAFATDATLVLRGIINVLMAEVTSHGNIKLGSKFTLTASVLVTDFLIVVPNDTVLRVILFGLHNF